MKFNSFFIFISLIILSLSISRKIKNKAEKVNTNTHTATHVKLKAKTFALKAYTATILIDGKKEGTGLFSTDSLTNPKHDENQGLTFKLNFEPSSENMTNLFVQSGDNYYLPYRSISSDILYINPFGSPKRFEITVTCDKGSVHYIQLLLPYAEEKTFINDEESNVIRGLINSLRVKEQEKISNFKKSASLIGSEYVNEKPLLNTANKSENDFNQAVKLSQDESEALSIILKSDTNTYNSIKSQYDKVEKEYTLLRNRLYYLNEKISQAKNLRISKTNSAKDFKDKTAESVKPTLEQETKKHEEDFELALAKLTAEVPEQSTALQVARNLILNEFDLGKYSKLVGSIYSGN